MAVSHPKLVVVGGCVLDVQARPSCGELLRGGSVPGEVAQLPGGVGRNIAEAASRLTSSPADVLLISAVGEDAAGEALLAACSRQGLATRGIVRCPDIATSTVVIVFDGTGEVAASVADVKAAGALTAQRLQRFAPDIQRAGLLVLDANLGAEALGAACAAAAGAGVPVLFEPVSVPKSPRCLPVLHQLAYAAPNAAELCAIAAQLRAQHGRAPLPPPPVGEAGAGGGSGGAQRQLQALAPHAGEVLAAGLRCVLLTMGGDGATLLQLQGRAVRASHLPALPAQVVSVSGAGDCLVAGFAAALLRGRSQEQALALGIASAAAAVASEGNVPDTVHFGFDHLEAVAERLLRQLSVLTLPIQAVL